MKHFRITLASLMLLSFPATSAYAAPPYCNGHNNGGCYYNAYYNVVLDMTISGIKCPGADGTTVEIFEGDITQQVRNLLGNS